MLKFSFLKPYHCEQSAGLPASLNRNQNQQLALARPSDATKKRGF